jgi:hypothetical protein
MRRNEKSQQMIPAGVVIRTNTQSHMMAAIQGYTRHTSSCMCVGFPRSPQSLTNVSSWGFSALPPACNSNYLGYRDRGCHFPLH